MDHASEGAIKGEEKDRSIVESVPEVELRWVEMPGVFKSRRSGVVESRLSIILPRWFVSKEGFVMTPHVGL